MSDDNTDPNDPTNRLREAQKQATLARQELDRDSPEWAYAQRAVANAESARVHLEGLEILEESNDVGEQSEVKGWES